MQRSQLQHQVAPNHLREEILVVPRSLLFQTVQPWHGINHSVTEPFTKIIQDQAVYMPRSHAETDPKYKQIIPYLIFTHEQKIFVMQRKQSASEQRLAGKFSLGIGGHIRQEDIVDSNIVSWAMREFHEEVAYHGTMSTSTVGILNDDSSDVGKIHLGMILISKGSSDDIDIKDEHKNGTLLTLEECQKLYDSMESWSQICFDFIVQNSLLTR